MELAELKNFKDLPAIDIADIHNSCFAQTINTFFGLWNHRGQVHRP